MRLLEVAIDPSDMQKYSCNQMATRGFQGLQGPMGLTPSVNYGNIAYVSTTGNDNTGMVGDPLRTFATVSAAYSALGNGTIYLLPGSYAGNITVTSGTLTIVGDSRKNTILTSTITLNGGILNLHSIKISTLNSPAISGSGGTLSLDDVSLVSKFGTSVTSTASTINANASINISNSVIKILTEPSTPVDSNIINGNKIIMISSRIINATFNASGTNVATVTSFIRGNLVSLSHVTLFFSVPGNQEFNTVYLFNVADGSTVSVSCLSLATIIGPTTVPAGKDFYIFPPGVVGKFSLTNLSLRGLSTFVNVHTTLPAGSYQNIAYDVHKISPGAFSVSNGGLVSANGMVLTTNVLPANSGVYIPNDNDYLIVVNNTNIVLLDKTSQGNPNINGRQIAIYNNGSTNITISGFVSGYFVNNGSIILHPLNSILFQYVASLTTWLIISAT